jgi:hypothetical protein
MWEKFAEYFHSIQFVLCLYSLYLYLFVSEFFMIMIGQCPQLSGYHISIWLLLRFPYFAY